ncbi:MAG: NAD(P)/FAD-dependent oxidoreductase [Streptosporangiaceae bacterium]|nr:NAD(P)/FAD-dependent oxidoreductase [Streptosporangiaceae bacterium]
MADRTSSAGQGWDAIVVGAGLGGLTVAACLAIRALRVLVLEQHTVAGGNSQVFRRLGAYEFDVGTHYIGDCGPSGALPAIYRGLGLEGRITFREIDPDGFDRIVLPSVDVRVPRGWRAYRERMAQALPAEAEAVRTYVDRCAAIYATASQAQGASPGGQLSAADGSGTGLRTATVTLGALMRKCGLSARARTVLAAQIGNLGVAPDQVSVLSYVGMLGDYLEGAYYPEGGGQMLAATLVEALQAHGGELRTRSLVTEILTERGRVAGIRLADSTVLRAPVVISNADYRRTVLELLGSEQLPAAVAARAQRSVMAFPLVTLYLAIDEAAPSPPAANLWWYESEDVDALFHELMAGMLDAPRFAFISSGSAKDPRPRPTRARGAGRGRLLTAHHTVEVMTLCPVTGAWAVDEDARGYGYRADPCYDSRKRQAGAALLAVAERALGPLRDHILHSEVAMPETQVRFACSTGGTAYGLASTPRQFGPLRPDHQTPLPGLFLAGASTRSGMGIRGVIIGGVHCAEAVLGESILAEMYAGKVLGDPALLAPRPPGWDPLLASRGTRPGRGTLRVTAGAARRSG